MLANSSECTLRRRTRRRRRRAERGRQEGSGPLIAAPRQVNQRPSGGWPPSEQYPAIWLAAARTNRCDQHGQSPSSFSSQSSCSSSLSVIVHLKRSQLTWLRPISFYSGPLMRPAEYFSSAAKLSPFRAYIWPFAIQANATTHLMGAPLCAFSQVVVSTWPV